MSKDEQSLFLKVRNLSVVSDPKLSNYGQMRDHCHDFSFDFVLGRSYGVIGECGAGGWGLIYTICGKETAISGEILLDGKLCTTTELEKHVCYVGEEVVLPRKILGLRISSTMTIKDSILLGNKVNRKGDMLEESIQLFGLSHHRIDYKLPFVGNERWNASAAIGYAHGKTIFCFPWLNTGRIKKLTPRIRHIINVLTSRGCTVIIPTTKEESLIGIVDECVEIHHPDEFMGEINIDN